jgi:integrase
VFGRSASEPFTPTHVHAKARKAWAAENKRRSEEAAEKGTKPELLEPIGLHEARHTYLLLMHDAGLSLERIGDYVGHSSKYMTDRYRHLLDGHEAEAARAFDDYLARRTGRRQSISANSSGSATLR